MTHWLDSVPSTMDVAQRLAAEGCAAFTAVAAREQTAGQGRLGRSWHSPPGTGLYVSVVLRLEDPPPLVTLALGLAVREAIARVTGVECSLRWPNDLLRDGRKAAGILVQKHGDALIAGIGINVRPIEFPPDLASIAASLESECDFNALLETLLASIRHWTARPAQEVLVEFTRAAAYLDGTRVTVDDRLEGITAGLDDSGFLRIRTGDGKLHTILAGGVRASRS